jgi:ribose 5-phosphate isomerase B
MGGLMAKTLIALGCDHAGFALKEEVRCYLEGRGLEVLDVGCPTEASVDYPVFGAEVARRISSGEAARGIIICGSGIGMSIVANRFRGVRAALCTEPYSAQMSRRHNDANVLCLGARIVGPGLALEIIKTFIETEFEGGRHQRRVDMIDEVANKG